MMKAPPPSLESYFQGLQGKNETSPPPLIQNNAPQMQNNPANMEVLKLKQYQAKRNELQHQLVMIDNQIMKIQGALEVLGNLGIRPS